MSILFKKEGEVTIMKKNIGVTTINSLRRRCFENINYDVPVSKKSWLIYLLLVGVPLPLIIAEEKEDKLFVFYGGNEIGAILQFIRGEFALEKVVGFNKLIDKELEGKTFFDFSDELKEKFLETEIAISVFRPPLNEEERKFAFMALKDTSKLATEPVKEENKLPNIEQKNETRSINEQLEQLLTHQFFEKVNISPLTIDVPIQLFMITKDGVTSNLSSRKIIEFKEAMKKVPDITPELDYMNVAFAEKKQFLKKAHLPMISICAHLAIENGVNPSEFDKIIEEFFAKNNPQYKKACDNGTASKSNVNIRLNIMKKFFEEYIETK